MRSTGIRSVMAGVLGLVAVSGLAGCASTSARGYDDELPSHRMTGMEPSGSVTRVDDTQQVIVLENGQMYRVSGNNAVYVDGRPVAFRTLRPGSRVTIVNGTPVVYQNGQYVVVQPSQGAVAPGGVLTPQPSGTVVAAPPAAVVTAPQTAVVVPGTLRMTGRITALTMPSNNADTSNACQPVITTPGKIASAAQRPNAVIRSRKKKPFMERKITGRR